MTYCFLLTHYRGVTIENRRAAKRTATQSALLFVFCRICVLSYLYFVQLCIVTFVFCLLVFCHICELSLCVLSYLWIVFLRFVGLAFCLFAFCHICILSFCILSLLHFVVLYFVFSWVVFWPSCIMTDYLHFYVVHNYIPWI